ncbi:MAG TPA: extracellular solute-binding protein [Acidimicrobiales bacterium]|nr:extracellular solute-binding protein [Acidimicrobiales bacterium]
MRRSLGVALTAALMAVFTASCNSGSTRLVIYSGRTSNLITPLLKQFSEETGIKIDVRYGDSAELALLVDEEGKKSPADVFISQSPGAIGFLDSHKRLAGLDAAVLGKVEPEFRAADRRWVGLTGRVRTLVFNTEKVDRASLPASVLDLAQPAYKGRVALAPSNGSFQDFVSTLRELVGDDEAGAWLKAMADGGAPEYANNTAIVEAVARGEVEMGLVNHYYIARAKSEDADTPVDTYFFSANDPGRLLLVTAAGVLDTADKNVEATRLIRFLLGAKAQKFFAEETFEYPLAAGQEPVGSVPPLASIAPTTFDLGRLGADLQDTLDMIDESGLGR